MAKGKYLSNGQYYGFNVTSVNGQTGDVNVPTVAVSDTQPASNADIWIDTSEPSGESGTVVTKIGNAYGELTLDDDLEVVNNKIQVKQSNATSRPSSFSGDIHYNKYGKIVTVQYSGTISSLSPSTYVVLGTIPDGYRPRENTITSVNFTASTGSNYRNAIVYFYTNGEIRAYLYGSSAITTAINFIFEITYITA